MRACFDPDVLQYNPGNTAMLVDGIELKGKAPMRRLSNRIQETPGGHEEGGRPSVRSE